MRFSWMRGFSILVVTGGGCGGLFSQTVAPPATPPLTAASRVEPGLESAIGWKWWVSSSEGKQWGMPLPEELRPKQPGETAVAPVETRPDSYEVKKGDALAKIAKKFDMTLWQLKQFNELKSDTIQVGQTLRIPTVAELVKLVPPPPPPEKEPEGKKKKKGKEIVEEPAPEMDWEAQQELETVRLQVFLDREMFSPGLIDGKPGATFLKISEIYQKSRPDAANPGLLKIKAEAAVKEPYTEYVLRTDDFKFIKPPKPVAGESTPARKKGAKPDKTAPAPKPAAPAIDDLVAEDFLGYTSAWEFVAERFHCDENFLRHLNPLLKEPLVVGAPFKVPAVVPFEIEKALEAPLQPAADPQKPVSAAVVLLSRLEISCEGKLVAVMPFATARPGLRGRGRWTVMDAIPAPRMATKREQRETPKPPPPTTAPVPGGATAPPPPPAAPVPVIQPPLEKEQYLAAGPNNPVGIIWINLGKSGETEALPYGLHGTGTPGRMATQQGIGGFRLTNWDIARAVRLIPAGTQLQWKAQ